MTPEPSSRGEVFPPGSGVPPRGLTLPLRTVLLLLLLGAGTYAAALSVYLAVRVGSAAGALGRGTESFLTLLEEQQRREAALHRAADFAAEALRIRAPLGAPILDSVKELATAGSVRSRAQPFAAVATRQRVLLARSDEWMSSVGNALVEVGAHLDLAQWGEASDHLQRAHQLSDSLGAAMVLASAAGSGDLLARQENLRSALDQAWRAAVIWLAVGAALLPLALGLIRRRIWRPLTELKGGLARVAAGDLTTQVPIARADELGQVTQHFNDMTRVLRNRAEEQGRFAAAGELLAGVAHEVNNPLMAIAVHAEARLGEPGLDSEHRDETQQILRQARRASKLLRGLLRFVRPHEHETTRLNLNEVVRGAVDLVSYQFGVDEIQLEEHLDQGLPAVLGDPIALEQVMVNLLSNAIDALRGTGTPRRLMVSSWVEDGRVRVAVADSGPGVPAAFVPNLFKPFASTKGARGTGLGLYVSRQILQEAGGDLALVSRPQEGARFVLSLPALPGGPAATTPVTADHIIVHPSPPPPATPAPAPPVAPAAPSVRSDSLAGVRVLIVDDEQPIRRGVARFLSRRGAQVLEAANGQDALDQVNAQAVDLIIADLRMPTMSGVELHARLRATHPRLADRLLLMSGDISQLSQAGGVPVVRERVLEKPLKLAELEQRILQLLATAT